VSLTVVFRETALRSLARLRGEDKDLFTRTRRATSALADQPYPPGAVAWGATGVYPEAEVYANAVIIGPRNGQATVIRPRAAGKDAPPVTLRIRNHCT
jgi:hypothetical protein